MTDNTYSPESRRIFSPATFLGGVLAGIVAGILMAFSASAYTALKVGDWSAAMRMIAGTFYGPSTFLAGAEVIAIGVVTHLVVAAALGIVFAALARRLDSAAVGFWLGIAYGTAVCVFMTWIILPVFNEALSARVAMLPAFWFFLHWVYGASLGLFTPPLRHLFMRKAKPPVDLHKAA